jgi:hypothetical protein
MPLVFVHGVANRMGDGYRQAQAMRDRYFREIATAGMAASRQPPLNPYWGGLGGFLAWGDEACLPLEENQTFGAGGDEVLRAILAETAPDIMAPPDRMLVTLARKDLSRAVDALWAAAAHTIPVAGPANLDALAAAAGRAIAMVKADPRPAWLEDLADDGQFVDALLARLDASGPPATPRAQTFGVSDVWGHLKEASARLAQAAIGIVSDATRAVSDAARDLGRSAAGAVINPVVRAARPGINKQAILFLGDIFAYLSGRGTPGRGEGPIVQVVAGDFARASASRGADDPMIIVAHSMGGIISYDILSHFRTDLVCDLFVTVGSQVGVFAGLGLLSAVPVDRTLPPDPGRTKARVPANIRRWINVFDPADVLGFKADGVFDRVEDYAFSAGVSSLTAHGMYFERPHFYERLRARIRGDHS